MLNLYFIKELTHVFVSIEFSGLLLLFITILPPPPLLVWGAVFLKRRTGRGPGSRPLNNNAVLARYMLDTTPAGAEVHKTSVEVESICAKFKILLTVLISLYQMTVTAL